VPVPKEEEVNIAVSVGTMTKCYDYWRINLLILRRATTSLPLCLQMEGRGARVAPDEFYTPIDLRKKKSFTILDYGQNYLRFGLYDAERPWQELWNTPKKSKQGVAPIKFCPQCEYVVSVSAPKCPNCEYEFEKKDIPLEVGELIEITEAYTKMAEARKRIGDLSPEELAIYCKLKNKGNFAARVARTRHTEDDTYLQRFAKAMGNKPGWLDYQFKLLENNHDNIGFTNFILI
jgi:superfamily II DNA or RNA helicase